MSMPTQEEVQFLTFFIYSLVAVFICIFFLLISNRLWAFIISKLLCFYLWKRHRAWIQIGSIKVSFLGGRILFKHLKYKSLNQSIFVVQGYVTFRYWLQNLPREQNIEDPTLDAHEKKPKRIQIHLNGLEWFIYNKIYAYEWLKTEIDKLNNPQREPRRTSIQNPNEEKESFLSRILHIEIDIGRGAIVLGNREMPSIAVLDFQSMRGVYKFSKSRSSLDKGKYSLELTILTPKLQLRTNIDYKGNQKKPNQKSKETFWSKLFHSKNSDRRSFRKKNVLGANADEQWKGLSRYQLNSKNEIDSQAFEEYAKVTSIIDSMCLELNYYSDDPGYVPSDSGYFNTNDNFQKANGGLSPQYGIDLKFTNTIIHYGPWADRQRGPLQSFFFPFSYRTFPPTEFPIPGQLRVFTSLTIYVEFQGDINWRLPTRELSKDGKFQLSKQNEEPKSNDTTNNRAYGWLDLKFGKDTNFNITIPLITDENGYSTIFELKTNDLEVSTSLNYAHMLIAKKFKMSGNMASPLIWNDIHDWVFCFEFESPSLFILRDDITLLQDLIADWNDRPAVDSKLFIPYRYILTLKMLNPIIYLCVNENNVIHQPNDLDENNFFIISTSNLTIGVTMQYLKFDEAVNRMPFTFGAPYLKLKFSPTVSSTLGTFLSSESKELITVQDFLLNGYYETCLIMDVIQPPSSNNVEIKAYGYFAKYFFILLSNYAGYTINFITLDEYRQRITPQLDEKIIKQANTSTKLAVSTQEFLIEFLLTFQLERVKIYLPENLYTFEHYSCLTLNELQFELRNGIDFTDLNVTFSPINLNRKVKLSSTSDQELLFDLEGSGKVFIEGLEISLHRLNGPAPNNETYLNDLSVNIGQISADMKPQFIEGLLKFSDAFIFHAQDLDNSLLPLFISPIDSLFIINVYFKSIALNLWCEGNHVIVAKLKKGINIKSDNWYTKDSVRMTTVEIPEINLQFLIRDLYYKNNEMIWLEVGSLTHYEMTVHIKDIDKDWKNRQEKQRDFLKQQDSLNGRCSAFYSTNVFGDFVVHEFHPFRDYRVYHPPFQRKFINNILVNEVVEDFRIFSHLKSNDEDFYNYTHQGSQDLIPESPIDEKYLEDNDDDEEEEIHNTPPIRIKKRTNEPPEIPYAEKLKKFSWIPGHDRKISKFFSLDMSQYSSFDKFSVENLPLKSFSCENEMTGTLVDLILNDSLTLLISPAILNHFSYLSISLTGQYLNLDDFPWSRVLDTLHLNYFNQLIPKSNSDFCFHLSISRLNLQSIQHYELAEEFSSPRKQSLKEHFEETSLLKMQISDIDLLYSADSDASVKIILKTKALDIEFGSIEFSTSMEELPKSFPFQYETNELSIVFLNDQQLVESSTNISQRFKIDFGNNQVKMTEKVISQVFASLKPWLEHPLPSHFTKYHLQYKNALQLCCLNLCHTGHHFIQELGDPLFMSKPSNLWRLRLLKYQMEDDWKIMMHLRFIFASLSKEKLKFLNHLLMKEKNDKLWLEKGKSQKRWQHCLDYLKPWRNWEISDLSNCRLISNLFIEQQKKLFDLPQRFIFAHCPTFVLQLSGVDQMKHYIKFEELEIKSIYQKEQQILWASILNFEIDAQHSLPMVLVLLFAQLEKNLKLFQSIKTKDISKEEMNNKSFISFGLKKGNLKWNLFEQFTFGFILNGFAMTNDQKELLTGQFFGIQNAKFSISNVVEDLLHLSIQNSQVLSLLNTKERLTKIVGTIENIYFNLFSNLLTLVEFNFFQAMYSVQNQILSAYEKFQSSESTNENQTKTLLMMKISQFVIQANLFPSLKLQHSFYQIVPSYSSEMHNNEFAMAIERQALSFVTYNQREKNSFSFGLPRLSIIGSQNLELSKVTVKFDKARISLGLETLGRLLNCQQFIQSDINSLFSLKVSPTVKSSEKSNPQKFCFDFKVDGIQFILETPLTSLKFVSSGIKAKISNQKSKMITGSLLMDRFQSQSNSFGHFELPSILVHGLMDPDSKVHLKVEIASCHNTATPAILSLVQTLFSQIETLSPLLLTEHSDFYQKKKHANDSFNLTLSLKINDIIFDLNCLPKSKVETVFLLQGLNLLITYNQSQWQLTSQLESFKSQLRHEYSNENCFLLDVQKVSAHFSSLNDKKTLIINIQQIEARHNIRQLQDFFIFKQMWPLSSFISFKSTPSLNRLQIKSQWHLLMKISNIKIIADLTQAIGKFQFLSENSRLNWTSVDEKWRQLFFSMDSFEWKSFGRLSGIVLGFLNLKLFFSTQSTENFVTEKTLTLFNVHVDRIFNLLEFNNDRIVVLDLDPCWLQLKDFYREFEPKQVDLDLELMIKRVHGILSKNSVPCFLRIWDKISGMVDEKAVVAFGVSVIKEESPRQVSKPKDILFSSLFSLVSVTMRVLDVELAFFRDQFEPQQDCLLLKMKSFSVDLTRTVENIRILRELTISLSLLLRKCNKKEEKTDTSTWSITQWQDHVHSRPFRLIMDLPQTQLYMETNQRLEDPLVEYTFQTTFDGAVDVNFNIAFFKFAQELASDFGESLNKTSQELSDYLRKQQSKLNALTTASTENEEEKSKTLQFKALSPMILEPQLKAIEGATPTDLLKWMGIQKESIPASVHLFLTLNLEKLLLLTLQNYQKHSLS